MPKTKIEYTRQGDYLIPNLTLPPQEKYPTPGKYGLLRKKYLKEHRKTMFMIYQAENTLNKHIHETDIQAREIMEQLTKQMAKEQGVTEELKATDQMLWVQKMNNIRSAAEEVVFAELIYV